MKTQQNLVIHIFVCLISLVIVVYISIQLCKSINIRYFSSTTQGKITGFYTKKAYARFERDRTPEYAPVFSFTDDTNTKIEVVTDVFNKK